MPATAPSKEQGALSTTTATAAPAAPAETVDEGPFGSYRQVVVILHNDIHMPYAKPDAARVYFDQMKALFARHPRTTIIWAHTGLGRIIQPLQGHVAMIEELLTDPQLGHMYVDISWSEVAKYVVASPDSVAIVAGMLERHPDRALFGTDEVAPKDQASYLKIYGQYAPLWQALSPKTSRQLRLGNYERLFDRARKQVRAWEAANVH